MKKILSFIAIVSIIFVSNCSRIPENNDPVIGIWSYETPITDGLVNKQSPQQQEWVFNDAYLGRYHLRENGKLLIKTDFKWSQDDGIYTISYPGLDDKTDDVVILKESEEGAMMLAHTNGNTMAIKE